MLRAMDPSALDTFRAFRSSFYDCLHHRADALFELTDAMLTAQAVPSPVHLSLQPSHRRGWGSLYEALSRGRSDVRALCGGCSPAIRLPEPKRPSTPWT